MNRLGQRYNAVSAMIPGIQFHKHVRKAMLLRSRSDRSLSSPRGGRTPRTPTTPTSARSNFAWEEENRWTDFQLSDDDAVDKPLLPLALPESWHDEGGTVVHKGPFSFVEALLLALAGAKWVQKWQFRAMALPGGSYVGERRVVPQGGSLNMPSVVSSPQPVRSVREPKGVLGGPYLSSPTSGVPSIGAKPTLESSTRYMASPPRFMNPAPKQPVTPPVLPPVTLPTLPTPVPAPMNPL
eukprot:s3679_g6.t1